MDKIIKVTGYCPTQNKEYFVNIKYLDASTHITKKYIHGLSECEYIKFNKCDCVSNCPIINSSPTEL